MTLELDWSSLDAQLTLSTQRALSAAFAAGPRPNFLGPLTVTAFSFGDTEPQIQLTDITDIYKDFVAADHDDDDDDDLAPPPPPPPPPPPIDHTHDTLDSPPQPETGSASGPRPFPFPNPPLAPGPGVGASLFSPGLLHHSFAPSPASFSRSRSRSHSPLPHAVPGSAFPAAAAGGGGGDAHSHSHSHTHPHSYTPPSPTPSHASLPTPAPSSAPSPSFQAHLHITYTGNLALGLSTSLLINYPSPSFMALPLQLNLTALAFEGTLVVAFEGGRRRVHLSLLDPGPSGAGDGAGVGAAKQTAGARLLKSATVESEVGQADKHVLKNVGKVEKFVLEVARRTLENEMVFPNFQTVLF
ncbi:hypothetical protein JCM10207_009310 [Rhodosporidiobolus poonsookiae]